MINLITLSIHKKVVLVFFLFFITLNSYSCNSNKRLTEEMKSLFSQILLNTYGDMNETQLYGKFLSDFINKEGKVNLNVKSKELERINKKLFKDDNFYYYYPKLAFAKDYKEFKRIKSELDCHQNVLIFIGKENEQVTKFGAYLSNPGYFSNIINEYAHVSVLKTLNEYYFQMGILSYFVFADRVTENIECLEYPVLKELTAILFWKYICDQVDILFPQYYE
jgi:predicted DNA binding CopG/RHH family protein